MEVIRKKLIARDGVVRLTAVGDVHYGQRYHDNKTFTKYMDWLEDNDSEIILMGDMCEVATTRHKEDQIKTIDEQIDYIVERFQNMAEQGRIWGFLQGNHEFRGIRDAGIDPAYIMAKELNIEYLGVGKVFYINIKDDNSRRGQNYTIYAKHGSSGARRPSGRMNAVLRMNEIINNADLYLHAHLHSKECVQTAPYTIDRGNMRMHVQQYLITGHYLSYPGSYAERGGYAPSCPSGSPRINFHSDKNEITIKL